MKNNGVRTLATLEIYRRTVAARLADYRLAVALQAAETAAIADGQAALTAATDAQRAAQTLAATVQAQAHAALAHVVSRCLAAVFDDPYTFEITFERKRGRTEATLTFARGGLAVDPLSAAGGGAVDVAGFALRVAALCLSRPARRLLIVADEPFRFVSAQYRPRVRAMLETLAEEFGIQFLIVTHLEDLQCGAVIEIG